MEKNQNIHLKLLKYSLNNKKTLPRIPVVEPIKTSDGGTKASIRYLTIFTVSKCLHEKHSED